MNSKTENGLFTRKKRRIIMKKTAAVILSILMLITMSVIPSFAADGGAVVTFTGSEATVSGSGDGLSVKGTDVKITAAGTYTFKGSCEDGTIVVKKNVTGVTLILDGLNLSAHATAPVTCNKGTQVNIVAAAGSVNTLADDQYNNDDVYTDTELYPDIENAVIKCKDGSDVVISGTGTININSYGKNGIKGGYDLYEEDEDGNATDSLLSTSSLTIKEVTLNIKASVNDGLKADKELNILSGNITVSAADDGIKSDYTLNIGAQGSDGPEIRVTDSNEGIEAATLNVYSENVTVNAADDGINAANSDLTGYSFSYNQYGGYVYVNCENGDGIDSNGSINLNGGALEVYSPSQGDGDPLDADGGIVFGGATVLAVGHNAMQQRYSAKTPYVVFGASSGRAGGFGQASSLVKAGSEITVGDSSGKALYSAEAVRDASYILFADSSLAGGSSYTLYSDGSKAATASATDASSGGSMPGQPGQPGRPGQSGQPELPGQPGAEPEQPSATQTDAGTGSGSDNGFLSFLGKIIDWFAYVIGIIKNFIAGII